MSDRHKTADHRHKEVPDTPMVENTEQVHPPTLGAEARTNDLQGVLGDEMERLMGLLRGGTS